MLLSNRAMKGGNPGKLYAFTNAVTTDWSAYTSKGNWMKSGMVRNFHCGDAVVSGLTNKASQPSGCTHPVAYVLPQKPGRISSRKLCYATLGGTATLTVGSLIFTSSCIVGVSGTATGTLIVGTLINGTVAIVIDGSAVGSMSLGAAGLATITLEASGAILGHVPATGSAPVLLGAIADLTALGWLAGSGPLEISGTLQSYGIGWLEGSTEDKSTLTATNIARATWEALQNEINLPGTAGGALMAAGAAGNPWIETLPGAYTPGQAGYIIGTNLDQPISDVSVVATGGAMNKRADSCTINVGTEVSGTYINTYDLDSVRHVIEPVGGVLDVVYEFSLGPDNVGVSITEIGRIDGNKSGSIQAYRWIDSSYYAIGTISGKSSDTTDTGVLFFNNTGTDANEGIVKIRFYATGLSISNRLMIDMMWVSYASTAPGLTDDEHAQLMKTLTTAKFLGLK
jgi:hypothetical protein